MSTTIITALFDINRQNFKNQNLALKSIEDYLPWFKKTLQLNCPMVIFTEEKLKEFVLENRPKNYKTDIIIQKLEEIPYYKYKDQINTIINSREYKSKIQHPDRIECNLPEYSIIQYSKFEWLSIVSEKNPFSTNYFFWMDAGCSRFFYDFNIKKEFPSSKINSFFENNLKNKLLIQGRADLGFFDINDKFIWKSDNLLIGTLFGCHKDFCNLFSKKINFIFENKMLKNNNLNNEQLALALLWKTEPNLFYVILNNNPKIHLPLFIAMSN